MKEYFHFFTYKGTPNKITFLWETMETEGNVITIPGLKENK
jgi:hypothetical protein